MTHPRQTVHCDSLVIVMGILNVTPDSFSDGGSFLEPQRALDHAGRMINGGAAIIDVGPESTRPGSLSVPADEQIRRAIPVVRALRTQHPRVGISIDTTNARVAVAAIDAGATMVNDTSSLRDDPDMVRVVADAGVNVVLMHRRGTPDSMQQNGGPEYENVVEEIRSFLDERIRFAMQNGISLDRIIVDPGIGFGKQTKHNLAILSQAGRFGEHTAGCVPVLIGASRKRFLRETLGIDDPVDRDAASATAALLAAQNGARLLRVHDVAGTISALKLWRAIESSGVTLPESGGKPVAQNSYSC